MRLIIAAEGNTQLAPLCELVIEQLKMKQLHHPAPYSAAADSLQSKLSGAEYADLEVSDLINYSLVSALPEAML